MTLFQDRADAGRQLGKKLHALAGDSDQLVLGIPRGGVVVAFRVARALGSPLDIFLSRKLGVPGHEELAFGAIASGALPVLDQEVLRGAGVTRQQIDRIAERAVESLRQRAQLYRAGMAPLDVAGKAVILVDDGIATGSSMLAAIQGLRSMRPARLVAAVPVAPASTCRWLRGEVDELVCLCRPEDFYAVGQFYRDFHEVSDDEVISLLHGRANPG